MKVIVLLLLLGSGTLTAAAQTAPGNTLLRLSTVGLPFAASFSKKGINVGVGRAEGRDAAEVATVEVSGDETPSGDAEGEPWFFDAWLPQPVAISTTTATAFPCQDLHTFIPAPTRFRPSPASPVRRQHHTPVSQRNGTLSAVQVSMGHAEWNVGAHEAISKARITPSALSTEQVSGRLPARSATHSAAADDSTLGCGCPRSDPPPPPGRQPA